MKNRLITLAGFLILSLHGSSQVRDLDSINLLVGKNITFCGKVADTYISKSDSAITFLNFGGMYPNVKLTAVIFKKDMVNFKEKPSAYYMSKNVCIKGEVILYKERPEIVLSRQRQIWDELN
jgi:hypothetical protein